MEILKKACEEIGIKFFEEKDKDYEWVEARYQFKDHHLVEKDFTEFEDMKAVLVNCMKNLIGVEQKTKDVEGVYADENRKLFYALKNPSTHDMFKYLLDNGWEIHLCSCTCSGNYTWMKPRPSGAHETAGCICHTDVEALYKEAKGFIV